jgi:hypothetical protein
VVMTDREESKRMNRFLEFGAQAVNTVICLFSTSLCL